MNGDYLLRPLGELGVLDRGRSRHRPRYAPHLYGGKYPFIQTGDIKASGGKITRYTQTYSEAGLEQSRLWEAGTLCITIAANIAETAILTFPACFPDSVVGFIGNPDLVDTRYVEYTFRHLRSRIQGDASGSVQDNINLEYLRNHHIPVYSLEDQIAIAHILGTLDDKIELIRKTNETLEAMAKALFKSWFVDFDPVRAKAEGRPTGLPAEISDLFPDSFEDSELGEIPNGWEMETLGEILDVDKGVSYKGDFLSDTEGLPMVNLGCFAGGGSFRAEKMKFYAGEYRERHLASAGDLLVANTDMTQNRIILGAPIVVPSWRGRDKFLFSHHTFAIRFRRSKSAFTRFIYFTLLKPSFRQVAAGHATGTTVLALPKDGITDYQTVIPTAGLLNVFAAKVEALYQKCQALTEQCELLAKTRDTLLPKLISGEIRIPDAEKILEGVGV
jgi:type I restriction enzyme S subunit